jgi:hypothetical protein
MTAIDSTVWSIACRNAGGRRYTGYDTLRRRWARIPAGLLLIVGGCLAILPIFGLWMIPLGLFLLAEDVPLLRRLRKRTLDWLERRWPHLFAHSHKPTSNKEETT